MSSMKPRPRVLFVHNKLTPFVRADRDLLRARYDVEELAVAGRWTAPWRLWPAVGRSDILFCWFASAHSLVPALLGRLRGRPVVVVVGGYDTANRPETGYGHQRGGLKKYVVRATIRLATHLITNSRFTRDEAVREAGASRDKMTVVYHGIAPSGVPPALTVGDGEAPAIVLTVGNVDRVNLRRKGLEPFVRAAAWLPDLRFVLAGAWLDDAIERLREIAPPNVTFTGGLSDAELAAVFRQAAVYVQASAHEGFGVALAEAMSAGCAPVVTRAGALPEVVGDAGVYAVSAAPADVATAIRQAMADRDALGAAARARVTQWFALERRAGGVAAVVDGALAGRFSPAAKKRPAKPPARRGTAGKGAAGPLPFVSVVIPTRDEQSSIAACLEAVLQQDYPATRIEALVVDGRSRDRTRAIVREIADADGGTRIRLLDNPRGVTSTALNIGIQAAHGEVIARVDGHTVVAPDYLRRCIEALRDSGADNVGGMMRPRGHGYIGACIALATGSRFGIGDSRFHYDERGGPAETVYLGCFRRAIFERVGLFDESLARNQDDELNDRILTAGGSIWLDPHIRSTYANRGSLRALWRQYYQYGYWKVRVLRRHPQALRPRHLAPAALVASLSASALLGALTPRLLRSSGSRSDRRMRAAYPPALAAWGAYAVASLGAGLIVAARAGWRYLPGLLASFWTLHLGYGAGFLAALLCGPRAADRPIIPRLEPQPAATTRLDSEAP